MKNEQFKNGQMSRQTVGRNLKMQKKKQAAYSISKSREK